MTWKKLCKNLLFLPIWLILILVVLSTVLLVAVFMNCDEKSLIAILVYVFAFYTLTVFCIACVKFAPGKYKKIKGKVYENRYANQYLTDKEFKTRVNLYRSFMINLVYVAVNAISSAVYNTYWFAIFAVYYMILAVMHFLLIRHVRKNEFGKRRIKELKRARLCACILMTLNLVLTGAVLMMIYFHRGFEYKGILIYVMAMYTFYITTTAIIDIVKYRKFNSPVMDVSKIIKLAAALVSMLLLETAMFSQFGKDMAWEHQKIMIMATGAGISVIVITLALYMIIKTTKEIRSKRNGK